MLKSLYSGVSGMKGFQTKLDVIGNNIANVNTVGFKKSRVMFQDIMNQNIAGATPPIGERGGKNPMQIGLGSKVGAIETLHTPGSPMTTYIGTDLMIDGDSYFVVGPKKSSFDADTNLLTKAGNFTRDSNGYLVTSNGYFLSGTNSIPSGPNPTDPLVEQQVSIKIVGDELTNSKFTSYSIDADGYINVVDADGRIGKLAVNSAGQYYLNESPDPTQQYENISITTGTVSNTAGLTKVGNTMFKVSGNSGQANIGRIAALEGGEIYSGSLEMSNVDLTEEFTEMIVAQRGFQANSRMITTSDSILEEVVNLKR
ncbi:flagellar hook-basal body complex protein [Bacillus sp. DNRA2]|uniref:flagellar hook-basal body complex protein n=1 Tax=Bacillus sp. DNRA2 TaxID=2723053 RepID=UPI00145DC25A|nr:flagellar hook-basal body complex protein [Bacillus sp. DNRA2]NMD69112.1 flagellar hook-basal body complex protein [Bacillus sp. DNRA2]